jgi:hypothetical protein
VKAENSDKMGAICEECGHLIHQHIGACLMQFCRCPKFTLMLKPNAGFKQVKDWIKS